MTGIIGMVTLLAGIIVISPFLILDETELWHLFFCGSSAVTPITMLLMSSIKEASFTSLSLSCSAFPLHHSCHSHCLILTVPLLQYLLLLV